MSQLRDSSLQYLTLLLAFGLFGCTYGPPEYRGRLGNVALLNDGRVAITYSQSISRRPTGLSTFPDGGASKILYERMLVALVDRNGSTREIARFENKALAGSGSIWVNWEEADPHHLYVTLGGQVTTRNPLRWRRDTVRMDLAGRKLATFDLKRELKRQGRDFGAKLFGGEQVVDADGTMLVGATRGDAQEVWRRDPDGRWSMLDEVENSVSVVGPDLVYLRRTEQFARNWRTGEVRRIAYFDPQLRQRVEPDRTDPALQPPPIKPRIKTFVSDDGHSVRISRDNVQVAQIWPDLTVLDRR